MNANSNTERKMDIWKRKYWILILFMGLPLGIYAQNEDQKNEILKNGETIREAFTNGDIEKIKSLHHPDVIKALGYTDVKVGREAVMDGLEETLRNFTLEFVKNDVENILFQDNIAVEQTRFSIKGTPKNGGEPFLFSGRTMVTYIRFDKSPTGWATIREIIQPSTEQ